MLLLSNALYLSVQYISFPKITLLWYKDKADWPELQNANVNVDNNEDDIDNGDEVYDANVDKLITWS